MGGHVLDHVTLVQDEALHTQLSEEPPVVSLTDASIVPGGREGGSEGGRRREQLGSDEDYCLKLTR